MQLRPPQLRTATERPALRLDAPVATQSALPEVVAPPRSPAAVPRRVRLRAGLRTAAALSALWWCLLPSSTGSWLVGAPAVLMGAALAAGLARDAARRISPLGALRFTTLFAVETLAGATDVARRALDPRLPVAPGFHEVALDLPEGAPRVLFANTVTLLPGTLSAAIRGDRLLIHSIDAGADLEAALNRLRKAVRRLYRLAEPAGTPHP